MAQNEGQRRATDAVAAEMLRREWTAMDLSVAAEIDYGTVLDFLKYARSPQTKTQAAMERTLGWAPGTYRRISLGQLDAPEPPTEEVPVGPDVEDDDTLNYRRPAGLTDEQWRHLKARTRNLVEWEIEQALRQNES